MAFPTSGLVSYWKLDESSGNATDSKGANTLTNNGSMTYGAAKIGNGAILNPTGSKYLSITDAAQTGLDFGTGDFSINLWMKSSSYANGAEIIEKQFISGNNNYYQIASGSTTNQVRVEVTGGVLVQNGANVFDGSFHMITMVRNGSTLSVYTDGGSVHSIGGANVDVSTDGIFFIGHGNNGTFNGTIDEVGVWNRALTSTEVTTLYNSGAGLTYSPSTSVTVTPSVTSATFSAPAPTFSNATPVTVTPAVQTATFSAPSVAVTAVKNVAIAAAVLALTFSSPGGSATSAGPKYPNVVFDNGTGSPYFGDGAWTNPDNVKASDSALAVAATDHIGNAFTTALTITDFGFSIPAGATINGVVAEISRKAATSGNLDDFLVKLVKSGSPVGTNKASASTWPTSLSTATYGSSSDVWGTALSASDINASNFGIIFQANEVTSTSGIASVDFVRITIYYTPPGVTVITTSTATITPSALSLTASIPAPTVKYDYVVSSSAASATFSAPAPTIISQSDVTVSAGVASATFSAQSPTVVTTTNISVSPSTSSASFSIPAPMVTGEAIVSPAVQSATFSAQAPTVTTTSNLTVAASVLTAAFTSQSPSLAFDYAVSVTTPTATFSVQAPTVIAVQTVIVQASVASAVFSAQSPTVQLDYVQSVSVLTATFSALSPTISNSTNITVSPPILSLTASTPAPTVLTEAIISPAVQVATFSIPSVALLTDQVLAMPVLVATFSAQSPTVIVTVSVTISASTLSIVSSIPSPSISTGTTVSVAVLSATFSIPPITVIAAPPRMRLGIAILTTKDPEMLVLKSKARVLHLGTKDNTIIL